MVDDEKIFLISLKRILDPVSHVFETDICFSVDEAIELVTKNVYDIIVTDIRMPERSGVELLLHLKKIRFPGRVMVMSGHDEDKTFPQVAPMGAVDVISKPFKVEWFRDMLLEWFKKRTKEESVTFESVDLATVMQIINLEAKTATLHIQVDEKEGMIYFEDGEVTHTEFDGIEGQKALLKILSIKTGVISVRKRIGRIKRTMDIPFVEHMVHIMKTIDEDRRDQEPAEEPDVLETDYREGVSEINREIFRIMDTLKEVRGFLGCGLFNSEGVLLGGALDLPGSHLEEAGALIRDSFGDARAVAKKIGFKKPGLIQMHTESGIIMEEYYNDGRLRFYILLVLEPDGNAAMGKRKLLEAAEQLAPVLADSVI